MGAVAVLAEVPETPWVKPEQHWLTIAKYIGFGISIALLSGYTVSLLCFESNHVQSTTRTTEIFVVGKSPVILLKRPKLR